MNLTVIDRYCLFCNKRVATKDPTKVRINGHEYHGSCLQAQVRQAGVLFAQAAKLHPEATRHIQ